AIEIITGNDPRYDEWIVKTGRTAQLVSVFVPVVLARDSAGSVVHGDALNPWLDDWKWSFGTHGSNSSGPTVITLSLPTTSNRRGVISWKIIGTIEAGFEDCSQQEIRRKDAIDLAKLAARNAVRIYRTQLEHVFQTVIEHACRLGGAKY